MFLWGFIAGIFFGATFGVVIIGLLTASKEPVCMPRLNKVGDRDFPPLGNWCAEDEIEKKDFSPPVNWCGEEPQGNMDNSDEFVGFM